MIISWCTYITALLNVAILKIVVVVGHRFYNCGLGSISLHTSDGDYIKSSKAVYLAFKIPHLKHKSKYTYIFYT